MVISKASLIVSEVRMCHYDTSKLGLWYAPLLAKWIVVMF